MQRDLLKAKFGKLPKDLPRGEDDDDDEERDVFPASLTPPTRKLRQSTMSGKDYSPKSASGYFASALEVDVALAEPGSNATFRVYYTPPTSHLSRDTGDQGSVGSATTEDPDQGHGVVFVCVHGAGYSGLSWALFGKSVVEKGRGKVGVLVYDARGHGKTRMTSSSSAEDEPQRQRERPIQPEMSLESLSSDLVSLLKSMFPDRSTAPAFLLVGHSMGGAVVTEACNTIQKEVGNVAGVAVIDVVEGTALEALEGMTGLIASRPKGFSSVENAIEWHVRSKTLNNLESARISVPPLLKDESASDPPTLHPYLWRTDLAATEPFWRGWFTGLSNKFLGCRTAKLLLLAGADRLDRDLMIGQMQGKYQLEVYPDVGHCVHEDAPDRAADTLLMFWERNDRTDALRGVKKVGQA